MATIQANSHPPETPTKHISSDMKYKEAPSAPKQTKFPCSDLSGLPPSGPSHEPTATNSASPPCNTTSFLDFHVQDKTKTPPKYYVHFHYG